MFWTHAHVLAQARAHLAALADETPSLEVSSAYELVLIALDRLHGDQSPDFEPVGTRLDPQFLATMAASAIKELETFGVDPLDIELLLAALEDAHALEAS